MSSVEAQKRAAFEAHLKRQGLSAEGWDMRVSEKTGKILKYSHAVHGQFRNREGVVRAMRGLPRRDPAAAGPSNAVFELSSDDEPGDQCPLCLDELDPDQTFTVGSCGHRFCSPCIGQHFEANASEPAILHPKRHLPSCPACSAAKAEKRPCFEGVITADDIAALRGAAHVSDSAHKRLDRAMVMATAPKGDHRVTCPKCDTLFLVQPGGGADGYIVDCPNRDCDCTGLCARCMVAHPGACPQVVADELTEAMFAGAVKCPGTCGFMLQKRDAACNCLTCDKCRINVCGLCGANITVAGHSHFHRPGEPCYGGEYADPVAWAKRHKK
jgi:hypothetical protein